MTPITRHYVEFNYPGTFLAEQSVREIEPGTLIPDIVPDSAFSWREFDVMETDVDGETLRSKRINEGPLHLITVDGPYTGDEIRSKFPELQILASNADQYKRGAARVRGGWWQPVHDADVVVRAESVPV